MSREHQPLSLKVFHKHFKKERGGLIQQVWRLWANPCKRDAFLQLLGVLQEKTLHGLFCPPQPGAHGRQTCPGPAPGFVSGSQPTSRPWEEAGSLCFRTRWITHLLTDKGGSPRSLHPTSASWDPPFHPRPHTQSWKLPYHNLHARALLSK